MTSDAETIGVYDRRTADYAKMVNAPADDFGLEAFVATLPAAAHVLDLGCGVGNCAARMLAQGCTVDAVDASVEMVRYAKDHYGVNARQALFDDIQGTAVYDAVWASFSLLHARKSDMQRHLSAIKTALKPGGTLHLGMKLGSGEGRDGMGRFYAYYFKDELIGLLQAAGFSPSGHQTGNGTGLAGRTDPWITITAHA